MTGSTLKLEYRFPDINTVSTSAAGAAPVTFTVGSGVEVSNWSVFGMTFDVSAASILLTFNQTNIIGNAGSFNGWSMTDVGNNLGDITSVTIDSSATNVSKATNSRITFDANHLYLNLSSCFVNASSVIKLNVTTAGSPSWLNANGSNNAWYVGSNWSSGVAPSAADNVTFNLNAVYGVQLIETNTANNLTVNNSNLTLAGVYASPRLSLGGGMTVAESAAAIVTLDGGALALTSADNGSIIVGDHNAGTFVAQNGANVTAARGLSIGNDTGGSGIATFTGSGTTATFAAPVTIGSSGAGTLRVLNGASVTTMGKTSMGVVANNDALVVQGASGTTAAQYSTTVLAVGGYQTGTGYVAGGSALVTIGTGGVVNVAGETRVLNGGSRIDLNGGTLNTTSIDFGNDSSHRLNWLSGTLGLGGGSVTGLNVPLTVPTFGILAGTGTIQGAVVVNDSGMLAPGTAGIGTLNVQSDIEIGGNGTLSWDFDPAAGTDDRIVGVGSANRLVIDGAGELRLISPDGVSAPAGPVVLLTGFESVTNLAYFRDWSVQLNGFNVDGARFVYDAANGSLSVALPEPTTLGMIVGAAVVTFAPRCRRRA